MRRCKRFKVESLKLKEKRKLSCRRYPSHIFKIVDGGHGNTNVQAFFRLRGSEPCEGAEFAPIILSLCGGVGRPRIGRIRAGWNRVSRKNAGAVREPELPRMAGLLHGQRLRNPPPPPLQHHTPFAPLARYFTSLQI